MGKEVSPISDNQKDEYARQWIADLKRAGANPRKIVADFIAEGSEMINYCPSKENVWNPALLNGSRTRILILSPYVSPAWAIETIKAGLEMTIPFRRSASIDNNPAYIVPYPRFSPGGKVNFPNSSLFLLTDKQIADLRKLI